MSILENKILKKKIFYEFSLSKKKEINNNLEKDFFDLLKKTVSNRSITDSTIGSFLSGGLDSSIISYLASNDEKISTFGLKYGAEENGCKSGYLFAIKTIDGRFIGTLGLDYTKRKTNLDMESINHLQVHASSLGGVLMTHLNQ